LNLMSSTRPSKNSLERAPETVHSKSLPKLIEDNSKERKFESKPLHSKAGNNTVLHSEKGKSRSKDALRGLRSTELPVIRPSRAKQPPQMLTHKGEPGPFSVVKRKAGKVSPSVPTKLQPVQKRQIPAKSVGYTGSSALPNRVATTNRVGIKDMISDRLKKKSPWYDSIMNPISGGGVKIPDPIGTDTGTYQHVQNVSVAVNAQGVAGLRIISPYINNFSHSAGSNYQQTGPTSSNGNLGWYDPGGFAGTSFAIVPGLMQANAHLHRVVSACVVAQPEVSSLGDAGEMCAFVTPLSCQNSTTTYATYQSQWDSTMMPVNAHKPLIARWYPLSGEFNDFDGQTLVAADDERILSYADFVDPIDGANDSGVIPWEIGCVCTGLTPSVGAVRFQMIVNYEFIPLQSSAMVDAKPSPVDPMEEQLVSQWVSNEPVTAVVPQKVASQAPAESHIEEPSGFGMLFNVVEEMMPYLKTGASLLSAF